MNKVSRYGRNSDIIKFGTDHSNQAFREEDADPDNHHRKASSMYSLAALAPKTTNLDQDVTQEDQENQERGSEQKSEVIEDTRRGRRYRAMSGASKKKIKIKKLIPLKDLA